LKPNSLASIVSHSNVDSTLVDFGLIPFYSNLTYATVLPSNHIEFQFYRDTLAELKNYTIYRGEARDKLLPIDFMLKSEVEDVDRFQYPDLAADPDVRSYYYQVVTQNECDNVIDVSNLGRTIHLTVESDDEGLRNTLRWNRYVGWDSTTSHVNIYRGLEGVYSTEVHAVVTPDSRYDYSSFVDDISFDVTSAGKFCYRVEAVQGPFNDKVVNNYPNNLGSQTSNSNVVCVVQEPLMYVPNAFAPDGVNRRFGPKGQFFNYTQFEMSIYNRWGELVYITRDINKGWNGTIDGDDAGNGSYVYIIRYVDGDGEEHRKKGTVTLIR
ncbi:MAG: gliding motility-associated C-terminal domain-containing protein, partial [Flavobacteriales bacterium]|nr:gliding motility-associated C-terminal domain-containing protein [Flavobacteriales bacterium]